VEAITITASDGQIIAHREGREFAFTLLISHLSGVFVQNK
jgi:hypothetical protein